METIAFQTEFRPALPVVFGAKDYREYREMIEEVDHFLTATEIEHRMLSRHLNTLSESCPTNRRSKSYKASRRALRYSILLAMTGLSHRTLSHRVADSALFQWFTHTTEIDGVRPSSKSAIERYEKRFSAEEISTLSHDCNMAVANPAGAQAQVIIDRIQNIRDQLPQAVHQAHERLDLFTKLHGACRSSHDLSQRRTPRHLTDILGKVANHCFLVTANFATIETFLASGQPEDG